MIYYNNNRLNYTISTSYICVCVKKNIDNLRNIEGREGKTGLAEQGPFPSKFFCFIFLFFILSISNL